MNTNSSRLLLLAALVALNVSAVRAQTEPELIAILQSNAGAVEKCAACQKLRLVGTAEAVPAVAALLTDERISQAARFALEGLSAPEASVALRDALGRTSGLLQAGVVDSLGWKRDPIAVSLLKPLLIDTDVAVASSAAAALGRIASKDALAALKAARTIAPPATRPAVLEALLRCAETRLAEGKTAEAKAIYQSLTQSSEADFVRVAAYVGLIRCAGKDALAQIESALHDKDPAAQVAALQLAGGLQDPKATAVFVGLLPKSQPSLQVALLALLRTRGDVAALPAVQAAAQSEDIEVRTAALAALGDLGDASQVPLLAKAATARDRAEQKAARQALAALHRGDVAGVLVAQLNTAPPAAQAELIRALTTRDEKAAVPALLQLARDGEPATRKGPLEALNKLADGSHLGALVQLLAAARDDDARAQVASVFESLSERLTGDKNLDFTPIVRGLSNGEFEVRKSLLQVSALFIDDSLRAAFQAALKDKDERMRAAATRALCMARDPALLPDLLAVARETSDPVLRSLAIEGIVRQASDEAAGHSADQRTEALAAGFELATRVEDKRRVLSGLARVPNRTTLEMVRKAATDPAVQAEAQAALVQITQKLRLSFIQDWLVCGPYRKAGAVGARAMFEIPFGPEQAGAKVQWRAMPRGEQVNLAALFPGEENCVAYLKAEVIAPAAADALLLLGSDDGVKAWLNGKLVHANNIDRGDVADQDQAAIRLAKGSNELLLKITQGGGGWSARARVVGTDGQPIAGLQVAPPAGAPPVTGQTPKSPPTPKAATLSPRVNFKKLRLSDQFIAEGAHFGDFNRDGHMDVVAGWQWFAGPDFKQEHDYTAPPGKPYDAEKSYSDYFLSYVYDFNSDGWLDILVYSWPGKDASWYQNPGETEGYWRKHTLLDEADNESPQFGDITGDGKPELICHSGGRFGFAEIDWDNPSSPAVFRPISPADPKKIFRYTHGYGFGDINGDGRTDIIEKNGWWEQPADYRAGGLWTFHKTPFIDPGGPGGAQMLVHDVNGDGRNDVISSLDSHGYGLAWFEQLEDGSFRRHMLVNTEPEDNPHGVKFTQIHALELADVNGDGLMDFITGKRFWAHGPDKDAEPAAPAVIYWFELTRGPDGTAGFIPHLVDDDSGVGTQVTAGDLNGDGLIDIISANKKGVFVFIQQPQP